MTQLLLFLTKNILSLLIYKKENIICQIKVIHVVQTT